jgi:aspartate carbamoyltransferase catalytic subunit
MYVSHNLITSPPEMRLSVKHLLGIRDLTPNDIQVILDTAISFKEVLQRPVKKVPALRDVSILNLFFENSTRTRISFELAEKRLSADTINFTISNSSVSKGETLLDTVNNILAMKVDMIVIRHSASGAPHFLARHIPAAIINAGDGINEHPTQGLLDAYSIREKFGKLEGVKVAIIGDIMHSRVALSNIYLLKKMGAEVTVAGPPTLIPRYMKEAFGVRVEYNLRKALEWCDVANVLRIQLERQNQVLFSSLREYSLAYGINKKLLDSLNKEIVIMHPGPINRGVELDSDVADSGQSIILHQVENGLAVRMAVLYLLSGQLESL